MRQQYQFIPDEYWDEDVKGLLAVALGQGFDEWWEDVQDALEVPPTPVQHIKTKEEAKQQSLWEMGEHGFNMVVLELDLHYPRAFLLKKVDEILREIHPEPEKPVERFGDYPLIKPPREDYVTKLLDIWQDRKHNKLKLLEIAVKYKLNLSADPTDRAGRNVLEISASKLMKQAELLLKNAGRGRFAVYDEVDEN